jgi:hypothetical protein
MIQVWKFVDGIDTGPLAANTYVYSLATYTDIELKTGITRVWVEPSSSNLGPDIHKRDWEVNQDASGNWQLTVSTKMVSNHVGKNIIIQYPARTAQITDISDTIALPRSYLLAFVTWWYAFHGLSVPETSRGTYEIRLMAMKREWEDALRQNKTLGPPSPTSWAKDRKFLVTEDE